MNIQPNRPLSIAVLKTRNSEISGFEEFYLLTCRNTLSDIRVSVSDEEEAWAVFREVYQQVWKKRDNMPEAGIVRPWIRVLIKDAAKKRLGLVIGEFAPETDREPVRGLDEKYSSALIQIEEKLDLLTLPDGITGKKDGGSMQVAVLRLVFALLGVTLAAAAAVILMRAVGKSASALRPAAEESSRNEIFVEAEEGTEAAQTQYGWNETRDGLRYREQDGSFKESSFLEYGDALYYLDENGYAATGSRQFGNQSFVFDENGVLKIISRSYGREQNETVLSVQLKEYGRGDEAQYIVDDSIILDGGWIYYLYQDGSEGGLPVLLRMKRESDVTEMIADHVTGYTVQEKNVWYCVNNEVLRFEKDTEAVEVGEGYTVAEEDGAWYLKDTYGRNVEGVGGYETISSRIYRLEDGRIRNVRPDTPRIDSYTFRAASAGSSNALLLGDGSTYLQQGEAIDAVGVIGKTLYYSVLLEGGSEPVSQIWSVNVYEGGANAVSSTFKGRVRTMYQFPEENAILMDYRPGGSLYGKIGMISGGRAYVLNDGDRRSGGFDSGNDQLQPVWTEDGVVHCYWNDVSGSVASDGTVEVLDTRTLDLSLDDRSSLGSGSAGGEAPQVSGIGEDSEESPTAEAVPGADTGEDRELSEDEMVEEAARTVSPEDVGITTEAEEDGGKEETEDEEEDGGEDSGEELVDGPVSSVPTSTISAPADWETTVAPGPTPSETLPAETAEETVPAGPGSAVFEAGETTMATVAPAPGPGV